VITTINCLISYHTFLISWENISCSRKTMYITAMVLQYNCTAVWQTLNTLQCSEPSCYNMHTKYNTLPTSKYFYITSSGTKKQDGTQGQHSQYSRKVRAGWTTNESCFSFWNFSNLSTLALGIHPAFYSMNAKDFFLPRVKQQWCEADHSPLSRVKHKEWCYNSTLLHASMQCTGLTLPLPLCCTHFISSMVALFIGSICNIWHSMLTTDLFRYSGMGKTPAITTVNSCHFLTETTKTPKT